MRARYIAACAAVIALHAAPVAAQGMAQCGIRGEIVEQLRERYGETLQMTGLGQRGVFETYANEETGTWTILLSIPDGRACLMAEGQNFQRPLDGQKAEN